MRIAHLSDPHVASLCWENLADSLSPKVLLGTLAFLINRARRHRVEIFEAMLEDINEQGIDHVVVTGDLVNLGLEEEFRRAALALSKLRLGTHDVTLVPGNHDYYTTAAVSEHRFERFLGAYATGDGHRAVAYPFVRIRNEAALVGVCSVYASLPGLADGRIGRDQLRRLEQLLDSPEVRERFCIVLVHHPPITHKGRVLRALRDRELFQDILVRNRVGLVLHGHDHDSVYAVLLGVNGAIPVLGVASSSSAERKRGRRAAYQVLELKREGLIGVRMRVWDGAASRFVWNDRDLL